MGGVAYNELLRLEFRTTGSCLRKSDLTRNWYNFPARLGGHPKSSDVS
jgi:hypothetical protein